LHAVDQALFGGNRDDDVKLVAVHAAGKNRVPDRDRVRY
jgi:hypothetical protein